MPLRAIIVDDERSACENLEILLKRNCPEINVLDTANSVASARELIQLYSPEVIFLDVEMPKENGLELLRSLPAYSFSAVFVTAYDSYALKALKASAVDYLLKPIVLSELKNTVSKLLCLHSKYKSNADSIPLSPITSSISTATRKITLAHNKGFKVVDPAEILHLEADSNYTKVYLKDGKKIIVTSTLKEFEDILDKNFFRIHKSHIVNLDFMEEYTSEDGGYIILKNGSRVEVSRRKFPEFLEFLSRTNTSIRH